MPAGRWYEWRGRRSIPDRPIWGSAFHLSSPSGHYLEDRRCWDCEIRHKVPGRPRRLRPLRPKVLLARGNKGTRREEAGGAYIGTLRELWADLNNEQLRWAGKYPSYDPRTFAEMGIDQEPQKHLDHARGAKLGGAACAGARSAGPLSGAGERLPERGSL